MTPHELTRAEEIFEREMRATNDWKQAIRAALLYYESRSSPERSRHATTPHLDTFSGPYRELAEAICQYMRVDIVEVCGTGWGTHAVATARGVLVSIMTDRLMSARRIVNLTGIGTAVVYNCRAARKKHPEWAPLIVEFAAKAA